MALHLQLLGAILLHLLLANMLLLRRHHQLRHALCNVHLSLLSQVGLLMEMVQASEFKGMKAAGFILTSLLV